MSNCRKVELVEFSNRRMVVLSKSSNLRIVEMVAELSNRRVVQWRNDGVDGVDGVVESSVGGVGNSSNRK